MVINVFPFRFLSQIFTNIHIQSILDQRTPKYMRLFILALIGSTNLNKWPSPSVLIVTDPRTDIVESVANSDGYDISRP